MNPSTSQLLTRSPLSATTEGLCCVCGGILPGCDRRSIFSKSTGSISVLAPIQSEVICVWCAALWKEPKVWARAILATSEQVSFPTIAPDPIGDRPTWKQALQNLNSGVERVCVLTTDPKKRVWPFAQVSKGDRFSMYVHDPSRGISSNRTVSLSRLLQCLEFVEQVYSAGFSKDAIAQSLYAAKTARDLDLAQVFEWERSLAEWRQTLEFIPALIISQKAEVFNVHAKPDFVQNDRPQCSSARGCGDEPSGDIQLSFIQS